MDKLKALWTSVTEILNAAAEWIALLPIRMLMGYEFASAGFRKLDASETVWGDVPNWFAGTRGDFPFPFNVLPIELSWFLVTWTEILGGIGLFIGLFTRFWAVSLIIVTIVAIFGVHWPDEWNSLADLWKGYVITNNGFGNYRVPLLFLAMLFPLAFIGPGRVCMDRILSTHVFKMGDQKL